MRIGIIGAGHIGGNLTRMLSALDNDVSVANSRGPQTLSDLAAETGAHAATPEDAVRNAELVIVSIPEKAVEQLAPALFDTRAPGAPIVDTGNYFPQYYGTIDPIEHGMPQSRWVEQQIGHSVIKAFNTLPANDLLTGGRPPGDASRLALPVAGDDLTAKRVVMHVVNELGFDAVDAGGLDASWRQQPGAPAYGAHDVVDLARALDAAVVKASTSAS